LQGARWIRRNRMRIERRRDAGKRAIELLIVAAYGNGKILEFHGTNFRARFGAVCLQRGRLTRNGYRLFNVSDLEDHVRSGNVVQRYRHVMPFSRFEPRQRYPYGVHARLKIDELLNAGGIGGGSLPDAGAWAGGGALGFRNARAVRICDIAQERAVKYLGTRREGTQS